MPVLSNIKSLLRNLFRKQRVEQDLDDEIRSHLELMTAQKISEGMTPQDAARAAKLELGGVEQIKEQVRAVQAGAQLETLLQDLRFGLRTLRKSPGFTAVAVLTLALGIGANTAIFTVIDSVLLRPLPYPHPERIVKVSSAYRGSVFQTVIAGPQYRFLRESSRSFESVEAHDVITSGVNVSGNPQPEHLVSAAVSADFFRVLGVAPLLGRTFTEAEDRPGGPCAVLLTYGLWRRRYAGDPAIVGRNLTLNAQTCLVTGVLPPTFSFDQSAEIFMPVRIPPVTRDPGHSYFMLARLRPGVTIDQARAEMPAIFARFKAAHGDLVARNETGIELQPYLDSIVGDVRPSLWLLFGAVGLLLLIACANVANLLLSRAANRTSEMAVRAALGAGRRRLTRQLITESALLAFAGGGFGLLMAYEGISALRGLAPGSLPRAADISLDPRVAGFAFFLSLLTVVAFGLLPALHTTGVDIHASLLAASGRTTSDTRSARARALLIAAEVALSVMLLAGAALLMRSLIALRGVPPGFDPANVLTFKMSPSPHYATTLLLQGFELQVLDRLRALPGVDSAAVAICLPLELGPDMPTEILGQSQPALLIKSPHYRTVSPDYFRTLGISLIRGRPFSDSDTADSAPVIIINASMARRSFQDRDPLGAHLQLGGGLGAEYADPPRVIVGVVGDVRESSLDKPADWTEFIPRAQVPTTMTADVNRLVGASWAIRTTIPPEQLADAVRRAVLAVDPQQPISAVRTMQDAMSQTLERQRFTVFLTTLFAALGVLLAAVGIYGVISYTVAQRTHEIGIRMALGAKRLDILKMMIRKGFHPVLMGVVVGLAAALALARFLSSVLYGVRPRDPLTFAAVAAALMAVALLACYIPARRATKVDPMVALRHE